MAKATFGSEHPSSPSGKTVDFGTDFSLIFPFSQATLLFHFFGPEPAQARDQKKCFVRAPKSSVPKFCRMGGGGFSFQSRSNRWNFEVWVPSSEFGLRRWGLGSKFEIRTSIRRWNFEVWARSCRSPAADVAAPKNGLSGWPSNGLNKPVFGEHHGQRPTCSIC